MVEFVPLVILIAYMLMMLGVGVVASRYTEATPADFYLSDKKVGTIILGFTLLATTLSAWGYFGVGANASGSGLGILNFIALEMMLFGIVFMTLGRRVNRVGNIFDHLTPVEYLVDRYKSPGVGLMYLVISFIFLIAFVMTQMIGGAVALEILVGIPFVWGVIGVAIIMTIYLHIAGFRGVIWSDLIQGAVLSAVLLGLFTLILYTIGPGELVTSVQAEDPMLFDPVGSIGLWTGLYTWTFMAVFVIGVVAYPQVYQRFLSASSERVMVKSGLIFPVVGVPAMFVAVALGVWSVAIIPEPTNPDYVIPMIIDELFHPVVVGITLSAAVAALMSTADSVILSLSSMISRDVYKEYINKDATDQKEVHITQITLIIIIGLALIGSLIRPAGIFDLGALAVYGHAVAAPALLMSLYWGNATKKGAIVSMLVGGSLVLLFFFGFIPQSYAFGMHWGFVSLLVTIALFVGISLVAESPPEETVSRYKRNI
jgi:SSS family solute:Na+ symporter